MGGSVILPALSEAGRAEREASLLPCIRPDDLVALVLHVLDEALPFIGTFQRVVDGSDEIQLPAIAPQSRLVFAGTHLLFPCVLLRRLQHLQPMRYADFIIDLPVPLEVCGVLVQLFAINAAKGKTDNAMP